MNILILANNDVGLYQFRRELISALLQKHSVTISLPYGEYTIEDDGQSSYPVASHNILEGEYVTIGGTLYQATQNIPSGEPVIAGQNAVATTVEEQLLMMKGE